MSKVVLGYEELDVKKTMQVGAEFKPPVSDSATAPTLGKGAQRANPTTGAPEYWDGSAWVPTGTDSTNWTPGYTI